MSHSNGRADLGEVAPLTASLRDQIASHLRERILTGLIGPGTRLDLDELADTFRTSRTPVREALLILSSDGLVDLAPRRNATVIGLSTEDILDLYAMGGALSGIAAERATSRMTPADLQRLRACADDVIAAPRDSIVEMERRNLRFHREINRLGASRHLMHTLRRLQLMAPHTYFAHVPEQYESGIEDHEALLKAFADRAARKAHVIAKRHFVEGGILLVERLSSRTPETIRAMATASQPGF